MKIELLLHSVTQDQSAPPGDEAFYGWMHGPAAGDGGRNAARSEAQLPRYSLRKEPWGAVFVYGPFQEVYLTDNEAYGLLKRLKEGETLEEIRSNPGEAELSSIKQFEELLDRLRITPNA